MTTTTKRSKAQKRADAKYKETNKAKNKANQRENFANIAATFRKEEQKQIKAIFDGAGIKIADAIRGAAFALMNGETIPTRAEPLPIPTGADAPTE